MLPLQNRHSTVPVPQIARSHHHSPPQGSGASPPAPPMKPMRVCQHPIENLSAHGGGSALLSLFSIRSPLCCRSVDAGTSGGGGGRDEIARCVRLFKKSRGISVFRFRSWAPAPCRSRIRCPHRLWREDDGVGRGGGEGGGGWGIPVVVEAIVVPHVPAPPHTPVAR